MLPREETMNFDNEEPTYFIDRQGRQVPVFVIPAKEPPCRATLIDK